MLAKNRKIRQKNKTEKADVKIIKKRAKELEKILGKKLIQTIGEV